MKPDLESFRKIVSDDAALRARATLQPIGAAGDKVFPPTHSVGDDQAERRLRENRQFGAKYAWEWRRDGQGGEKPCVLLDSVQSQANRMEEALFYLWRQRRIVLPLVSIDFGESYADLKQINSLTAPHRIADALLRDSLLDGTPFRHSELGRTLSGSTLADVSGLFRTCPSGLVFGLWDSTGPTGTGLRLARNLTSEIVGIGATAGQKTGSRIDPAGILKSPKDVTIWRADPAKAPLEQWVLDETLAAKDKNGKSIKYGKGEKAGKTTSVNHSNVPPTLELLAGGITMDHAVQTVVISLSGLRRLAFGGSEEDDQKARTVLAALALIAVFACAENPGYFLRSRCQLTPERGQELAFKRISRNGNEEDFHLELKDALSLYQQSVNALPDRLTWRSWIGHGSPDRPATNGWANESLKPGEPIATLTPAPKLMTLIEGSRELATAGEADEDRQTT